MREKEVCFVCEQVLNGHFLHTENRASFLHVFLYDSAGLSKLFVGIAASRAGLHDDFEAVIVHEFLHLCRRQGASALPFVFAFPENSNGRTRATGLSSLTVHVFFLRR